MTVGVYPKMSMEDYMALPALNAGAVHASIDDCPRRGWLQSAFNPERVDDWSARSDKGTIAHAVLFEGGFDKVEVFDPADFPNQKGGGFATGWTNKAIRDARLLSRAQGMIPILKEDFSDVEAMVKAAVMYVDGLRDTEPAIWLAFQDDNADRELTCVWEESGILCKMRPDLIAKDRRLIVDGKFTETSANPEIWGRSMLGKMGYRTGAGWYRRGVQKLFGETPEYVFLVVEQKPPHLVSMVGLDPEQYAKADADAAFGLSVWETCISEATFPAYPKRVAYPAMSAWERAEMESS